MKKQFMKKGFLLGAAVVTMLGGVLFADQKKADAATRKCYTISSGNTTVYSNTGLTNRYGAIFGTDEITVQTVTGRYCKVTYPTSRGSKTGYIPTGAILRGTSGNDYRSRGKITTYKRPGGGSYGYVAVNDVVKVLGTYGNYTQVKYPVSGGYKYAFITTANANSYIYSQQAAAPAPAPVVNNGTVQQNIYNLAIASVGTNGRIYQNWCGLSSSDPYCAAYATYIANQAMIRAGYASARALQIVPKKASTALWADWFRNRNRYYSYAAWYNPSRGVRMAKNTSISSYAPRVGDLAAIDNNGNISTGPDHTGIVIAVSGNSLTMAEGNTGAGTNATRTVKTYTYYKGGTYWYRSGAAGTVVVGFGNPAY